jgi:integrase
MAHASKPELVRTEMNAVLERFGRYLTGTRYDRRRKLRALTAAGYLNRMGLVMEWAGTLDPTIEQTQAYMAWLSDGCITRNEAPPSDSTKRQAFYVIKAWFEWKRTPLTEAQEAEFLVPPTPKNLRDAPLSLERIQELLAKTPDRRRYAILRTFLSTGIRRAELAALKVRHVDFEGQQLWVPEIGENGRAAAKGGSGGWVCIAPIALDAIREHLASRHLRAEPEAPLFESLASQDHLTPEGVTQLVGDLTQAVLGERITPHELRHAFASHAAAGGQDRPPMPIIALQRQLRHKDPKTTLRYVHGVGSIQEAYARSAPVF